jgi:hypothetical protein
LIPNRKFKSELVLRVFHEAGEIACQNGQRIAVRDFRRWIPGDRMLTNNIPAREPLDKFYLPVS